MNAIAQNIPPPISGQPCLPGDVERVNFPSILQLEEGKGYASPACCTEVFDEHGQAYSGLVAEPGDIFEITGSPVQMVVRGNFTTAARRACIPVRSRDGKPGYLVQDWTFYGTYSQEGTMDFEESLPKNAQSDLGCVDYSRRSDQRGRTNVLFRPDMPMGEFDTFPIICRGQRVHVLGRELDMQLHPDSDETMAVYLVVDEGVVAGYVPVSQVTLDRPDEEIAAVMDGISTASVVQSVRAGDSVPADLEDSGLFQRGTTYISGIGELDMCDAEGMLLDTSFLQSGDMLEVVDHGRVHQITIDHMGRDRTQSCLRVALPTGGEAFVLQQNTISGVYNGDGMLCDLPGITGPVPIGVVSERLFIQFGIDPDPMVGDPMARNCRVGSFIRVLGDPNLPIMVQESSGAQIGVVPVVAIDGSFSGYVPASFVSVNNPRR